MTQLSSTPLVGLDVQPHSMRLIVLKQHRNQYFAEQAASLTLPDEVHANGRIRHWDILQERLSALVRRLRLEKAATAIHLPSPLVCMQELQVPEGMTEDGIREEIDLHLARDFPGMSESLAVDFTIERKPESDGYMQIHFAATHLDYIARYADCIEAAGLQVSIIDVDVHALVRLFQLASRSIKKVQAIVCQIHTRIWFMVISPQAILFHQQWQALNRQEFIAQLNKQIANFLAHFPDVRIHQLLVYSQYSGIELYFANHQTLQLRVYRLNPFARIKLSPSLVAQMQQEHFADYFIACGLAMREVPAC